MGRCGRSSSVCWLVGILLNAWALTAFAADPAPSHGLAIFGDLALPADFTHFEYVNPDAPKGGKLRQGVAESTFDSFNPWIIKGNPAAGIGLLYDTLMVGAADEPFSEYGLLAKTVQTPADRSWVAFELRPEARWHDGKPVTADDVVWSFETLLAKGAPTYRFYYQSVEKVEKTGERGVKFSFKPGTNRELPLIVGQLPVLPEALVGDAQLRSHHARAAARQRAVSSREVRGRALHRVGARRGLLGRGPPGQQGPLELRRPALRVLPRRHRRARGLQGRQLRLPRRGVRQGVGDGLRHSRSEGRPHRQGSGAEQAADGHAGLRDEPAPPALPGSPRARGARLSPSTSSGRTRRSSTASTRAPRATSRTPTWRRAGCRAARSSRSSSRTAAGFPTRSSPRRMPRPGPTARATTARTCAARRSC